MRPKQTIQNILRLKVYLNILKIHIPDAKLIYIIRNPVDRIYSQFTHNYYIGKVGNDLNKAISQNHNYNYINTSKYYMQLQRSLEAFDKNQIKVVLLEDLKNMPKDVIKDAYDFLDVDSSFIPPKPDEQKHQTINRCQPWRAKRRLVVPSRRAPLAAYPSCASARGDAA